MTMKTMEHLLKNYKEKFFRNMDERREKIALPIRPRDKKNRTFLDNEWFERGYASTFSWGVSITYFVIAKYANARTQSCFPSTETIMRNGGMSRGTVFSSTKILESHNVISVRRSKGRQPNVYTLLDCRVWPPPNGTVSGTVRKQRNGTIGEVQRYKQEDANGTVSGTGIHRMKSEKEIFGENNNFMKKIGKENQENALEGMILDRLSFSKKTLVSGYFDSMEVEEALKELQEGGIVFGSLTSK